MDVTKDYSFCQPRFQKRIEEPGNEARDLFLINIGVTMNYCKCEFPVNLEILPVQCGYENSNQLFSLHNPTMTLASMKFSEAIFVQQWPLRLFRAVFRIDEFVIDNNYPFTFRRGPILCRALRS